MLRSSVPEKFDVRPMTGRVWEEIRSYGLLVQPSEIVACALANVVNNGLLLLLSCTNDLPRASDQGKHFIVTHMTMLR